MPVFRPNAVVNLALRVEELGETGPLTGALDAGTPPTAAVPDIPPTATQQDLQRQVQQLNETLRTVLQATEMPSDQRDYSVRELKRRREQLLEQMAGRPASGVSAQLRPPALDGTPPDDRFVRGNILPRRIEIDRNSFRTADEATVVLNWADVPFDPRLVRSCAIEIVLGVVDAGEFEAGMSGARGLNGQLRSIVEVAPSLEGSATRFVGCVDNWTVEFDASGGDMVTLECRDLTCLFYDTPLPSGGGIDLSLPLQQGLQAFVDSFPSTRGIRVVWDEGVSLERQTARPGDVVPSARRSRRGRRVRQIRSGDQRMNCWDHITDVCVAANVIPMMHGTELLLSEPRTLLSAEDPRVRRMVYGRNLESLQFSRKLGGVNVPTVEVRCYDPSIGATRWGRYPVGEGQLSAGVFGQTNPPRPSRVSAATPSGTNPSDTIQTFQVRSLNSSEQCASVARGLYEQIGKQEIEGHFESNEIGDWNTELDVPGHLANLLTMTAGDSVEILVAPHDDTRSEVARITAAVLQALPRDARADYLERLGWDRAVAERFAELQDASGFQTVFRVQNVRMSMDEDDGFALKCDFINYITVRNDAQAVPEADAPTPAYAERLESVRNAGGPAAEALRRVRDQRAVLASLREKGTLQEDEYQRRVRELRDQERQLNQTLKGII